ncbi:MAG: hypothetical protein IKC65_06370 [Lentisphaeria bacterium]|nr:hypothetical protein [Lentisphaeria bacterium]
MKKSASLFLCSIALLLLCGCACTAPRNAAAPAVEKKIKTGFYIDLGSRGNGVLELARLLSYTPQLELRLLTGEDLRKGALKEIELLVMPGGSSKLQMRSMAPEGVKALREFVQNGGSYVGICAGFHITLNRKERAALLPYTYIPEAVGAKGHVFIDLSPEGADILNVKSGRYRVVYSRGPVAREGAWDKGSCQTLARYKSSVGPVNRPGKSFFNTPALICGTFGKGKVIATSFHPEYDAGTRALLHGCIYAVTGRKTAPVFPRKNFHPFRVAYYNTAPMTGNNQGAIKDLLALDSSPAISVQMGLSEQLLENVDILYLPDSPAHIWKDLAKGYLAGIMTCFMDNGGRVIAVGPGWDQMPSHRNLHRVPAGTSPVKAVLETTGAN